MKTFMTTIAVLAVAGSATAAIESWSNQVSFISDAEPAGSVSIPQFDTLGGTRSLNSISITYCFKGSADIAADNDDPFKAGSANGRIIRTFTATGPGGAFGFGTKTIITAAVALAADNGDGAGSFDSTGPDGVVFPTLAFPYEVAMVGGAALGPYLGAGSVNFSVTPSVMVNDLQFSATDQYQTQVSNPDLTVQIKVDYDYTIVPAPGALALMGMGGLVAGRRRR
jgi:hypothetical protein